MNINHDAFENIEKSNVYLCKPNGDKICALNGIDENTFEYTSKLKDFDTLQFSVDKYIDIDGVATKSNGYDKLAYRMEISVDNVGRFIITSPPTITNDGVKETKTIECSSLEWNFLSKDIVNFKINTGESSSIERLYPDNIDALDRTINYIKVYDAINTNLSLLNIILGYIKGWTVGYVSPTIASKTPYFNIESTSLYSFMMQDISKSLQCIFKFDTINKTVNIYDEDSIGSDTNVFISFKNLAKKIDITPQTENIYTRYTVVGNDDLDITQANFGDSKIEDISNYLTTDYLSAEIIEKYNAYTTFKESKRTDYINLIKSFVSVQENRDEIINRLPIDDLNIDWDTFSATELNEELEYFQGLVDCIEADYTVGGVLDLNALMASIYWWDYKSYTEWIIPNIEIAISNIGKTSAQKTDYDNSWETEWDLYGTTELNVKINLYKEQMESTKDYSKAWSELTTAEKSLYVESNYTQLHNVYLQAQTNFNGATTKYNSLVSTISGYDTQLTTIQTSINTLVASVNISNSSFEFTEDELKTIDGLYVDTDYKNENFSITNYTTLSEKVDEELNLLNYAKEDLAKQCKPQYSFSTEIDNLLNLEEFKVWNTSIDVGNFITLDTDNSQEKLRLISITFNPMLSDNDSLTVEFSNILTWNGQRNDFTDLFDNSISSSKNSISRGSSVSSDDTTKASNELIKYILNSRQMSQNLDNLKINTLVTNEAKINTALIDYAKVDTIEGLVATFVTQTVDTQFVKDLIAGHITVADLAANTTTSSFVTIGQDSNGNKIQINANTMQFVDSEGNIYIQMGIDAQGNKTFLLTDENGTTLIDSTGVHAGAIPDGLIVSDMMKKKDTTYTGIGSDILNIDSVVQGINNGTTTIKSTQIYFDEDSQTLNSKMGELTTSVDDLDSTVTSQGTTITQNSNSINQLITNTTIQKSDGTTVLLKDDYNITKDTVDGHTQSIGSVETSVSTLSENLATFSNATTNSLTSLQEQIDGSIMTWFYSLAPTLTNVPASDWTTTDLKNKHLGDLYYDTITGYCYRWQVLNNTYSWQRITDTDVTKALSDASKAQDTADSKRRVFVVQPTCPYEIGDLWSGGSTGDLKRCKVTRLTGTYVATDWELASKYTDDTKANTVANNLSTNYSTTTAMNSAITQAKNEINLNVSSTATSTLNSAKSYTDTAKASAISTASTDATTKATQAKTDAIADTTTKLQSYSTTTQMNSAINVATNNINLSVSKSISETNNGTVDTQIGESVTSTKSQDSYAQVDILGKSIQNGTPSPTTPIAIESVGDLNSTTQKYDIPIISCGKNMCNFTTDGNIWLTNKIVSYTTGNQVIKAGFNEVKFRVKPNTTYYFTTNASTWSDLVFYDSKMNYLLGGAFIKGGVITTKPNCYYIAIAIKNDATWCQFELGNLATTYETYKGIKKTISLIGPLRGIGNVCDQLTQLTEDMVINGTTVKKGDWVRKHNFGIIPRYNGETISGNYMSSTGSLTTGATVIYQLAAAPIYYILDSTTQTALHSIKTYDGTCNIYIDSVVSPTLDVDFKSNVYGQTIENKASLDIQDDKISAVVSSVDSEGSVVLTDNALDVIADNINLTGKVTFSSLDTSTQTKINTIETTANGTSTTLSGLTTTENSTTVVDGSKIKTGSVAANQIASNAITTDKLGANVVKANNIDVADLFAQSITATGSITGATIIQTKIIDGTTYTTKLNDGILSMIASTVLEGESVETGIVLKVLPATIYNSRYECSLSFGNGTYFTPSQGMIPQLSVPGDLSAKYIINTGYQRYTSTAYPQIKGNGAYLGLSATSSEALFIDNPLKVFRPGSNGAYGLGSSSMKWGQIYSTNSAISTSDRNQKKDITSLSDKEIQLILELIPVSYKFKDGSSGRTHFGLIAQDVEDVLNKLGMTSLDFAGFIKSPHQEQVVYDVLDDDGNVVYNEDGTKKTDFKWETVDGEYDYGLRYEEFIAPTIKLVQDQQKEIESLKDEVAELKIMVQQLINK